MRARIARWLAARGVWPWADINALRVANERLSARNVEMERKQSSSDAQVRDLSEARDHLFRVARARRDQLRRLGVEPAGDPSMAIRTPVMLDGAARAEELKAMARD